MTPTETTASPQPQGDGEETSALKEVEKLFRDGQERFRLYKDAQRALRALLESPVGPALSRSPKDTPDQEEVAIRWLERRLRTILGFAIRWEEPAVSLSEELDEP